MNITTMGNPVVVFCYGDKENGHCVYTSGHLTTTNQSEIRQAAICGEMIMFTV